ncbi:hypothetical protein SEUCBS140593_007481 [Sporothrix eucalyptigena]|uniref:Dihydrodipicolinate synthetase family protein n=1 Tax=Sporothrix eucalyptigena TaxID=1812306 RepID=A0ABP0CE82_9PEZI
MAPHNDAPSPSGSYTAGFNRFGLRGSATTSSGLRQSGFVDPLTADSASALSSSFSSQASLDGEVGSNFHSVKRRLLPGVYVPTMCFFDPATENVDTDTIARHAVRLARTGVMGLATQGSNGEAVHLTHSERRLVTKTTRVALDTAGFVDMPIIVGCGSQSTRETIELCQDAWAAGGDFALVLPPSYYAPLFAPSSQTILEYFRAVADASPIPLLIYNFPGAVNGMDMSSDIIVQLAAHPNIVGVKLTCGNTGKLNRVAAATRKMFPKKEGNIDDAPEFLVLGGSADFTIQTLVAGGHGILAGLANIAPKACIKTMELFNKGHLAEAQAMQEILSDGDWTAIKGGVVGVKAGLEAWSGYGGYARSPLPKPTADQAKQWKEGFRDLVLLEKSL